MATGGFQEPGPGRRESPVFSSVLIPFWFGCPSKDGDYSNRDGFCGGLFVPKQVLRFWLPGLPGEAFD